MVKVYCDRCGKELNTNDPNYYPLGDAENGDDIDLCQECMHEINNAVKTVWDSKSKVLVREIYGVCDEEREESK